MSISVRPHSSERVSEPLSSLPDLTGVRALVTGGTSGLGLATTRYLLSRGAAVVVGARDLERAERLRQVVSAELTLDPQALEVQRLDLMDLDSVRRFADLAPSALDLLVLNAGISSTPLRLSAQGVESQFATNHLGHFAVTGLLADALRAGRSPRVVTVSSALYRGAKLDLDDLGDSRTYSAGRAYARSKLANALFATELAARLGKTGRPVRSLLAHPGMARTPMHATYPSAVLRVMTGAVAGLIGRDVGPASVGIVYAATAPQVDPALFWGPVGSRRQPDVRGVPLDASVLHAGQAGALWQRSVELTGIDY